jgi:hypothetical protein
MCDPYKDAKIYGPYTRKDGRKHIIAIYPDGAKITVSYPRYLLEMKLGRFLDENEEVDHNDLDFTNDSLDNLVIREPIEHRELDARRLKPQTFMCPVCYRVFVLEGQTLHNVLTEQRRKNTTGPYCSRSCAGKGSRIQNRVRKVYTTNKSLNRE